MFEIVLIIWSGARMYMRNAKPALLLERKEKKDTTMGARKFSVYHMDVIRVPKGETFSMLLLRRFLGIVVVSGRAFTPNRDIGLGDEKPKIFELERCIITLESRGKETFQLAFLAIALAFFVWDHISFFEFSIAKMNAGAAARRRVSYYHVFSARGDHEKCIFTKGWEMGYRR
jgi:hypothetical protein